MPIVKVKKQISKNPKVHGKQARWSEDQKLKAVAHYLNFGNLMQVHRIMNIPEETLRKWKASDWWRETEAEIREQARVGLSGKLGKIINKSLETVEDRLDNGDFVYDPKSGSIKRIGVKASVANQISKDMIDKQVLMDRLASKKNQDEDSIFDRLKSMKEEFLKFSSARTINAVKQELPEGLQTGIPELPRQAGTDQEAIRAEYSASGGSKEGTGS